MSLSLEQFIVERERIRVRHDSGAPKPWTSDAIMRKYFFTNIFREDDKVSKLLTSIMAGKTQDGLFLFNACVHRFISEYDFSATLGYAQSYDAFYNLYINRRKQGLSVRTKAFISCKSDEIFLADLKNVYEKKDILYNLIISRPEVKGAYDILITLPGFGKFLGWQVANDLLMYSMISETPHFIILGPGAELGFKYTAATSFDSLLKELNNSLPNDIKKLHHKDLEHALCEYGKYARLVEGKGKKRSYNGEV